MTIEAFEGRINYQTALGRQVDALKAEGRYRVFADLRRQCGGFPAGVRYTNGETRPVTVWCSNDYLGMGQHPTVLAAMHEAIDAVGAGSGGTRNISGTTHYHVELEQELADLHGKEASLVFTSAYVANDATLSTLVKLMPGTVVFSDEKNHASMIEGIRHGGGDKRVFRHNDLNDLEAKLRSTPTSTPKIIAFESVYSMDGHIARRADLFGRSPCCWHVRVARWRHGRTRRLHGPRRYHQRHTGQGLRRHGRLHRRNARAV